MAAHNLFYSRSSSSSSTAGLKPPISMHQLQRSTSSTSASESLMPRQGPPYPLPLEIRLEAEQDQILRRTTPLHRSPSIAEAGENAVDVQKSVGPAVKPKYSLPDISNESDNQITLGQFRPPPVVDMPTPQATLLLNFGAKLRTIMHHNNNNNENTNHRPPAAPSKLNRRKSHHGNQRDYRAVSMVCDDPSYSTTSASFLDVSAPCCSAANNSSHERIRSTSATPPVNSDTTKQQPKEIRQQQTSTPTEFRQTSAAVSCSPHRGATDDGGEFSVISQFCDGERGGEFVSDLPSESSADASNSQMRPKSKSVSGIFAKIAIHSKNRRERSEKMRYSELRTDQKTRDKNFDVREFHSLIAANADDTTDTQNLRLGSKSHLGSADPDAGRRYENNDNNKAAVAAVEVPAQEDDVFTSATTFSSSSAMRIFRSRTISSECNRVAEGGVSRHRRGASEKRSSQRRKTLYEEIQ